MVSQEVLVESLRLAGRIDELHQQLAECRRDARAWEVDYQAKEDELNEFADTALAEKTRIQLALDDACAQRDEYRERLAAFTGDTSLVETARSVKAQLVKAMEQLGNGEDDDAMLSLSRALAHAESVVDVLNQGGELS